MVTPKEIFKFASDQTRRVKPRYLPDNERNQPLRLAAGFLSPSDVAELAGTSELAVRREIALGHLEAHLSETAPIIPQRSLNEFLGRGGTFNEPQLRDGWYRSEICFAVNINEFGKKLARFTRQIKTETKLRQTTLQAAVIPAQIRGVFKRFGQDAIASRLHQAAKFACQRDGGNANPIETLFSDQKYFCAVKQESQQTVLSQTFRLALSDKQSVVIPFSACAESRTTFNRLVERISEECF